MQPESPLRILQIMRAPVGGLFRHVVDLTRDLARRGHAIGLVVDQGVSDTLSAERLAALAPAASLGIHRLALPRTVGLGDLTTPLALRKLGRDLKIDVLHGHGAKAGLYARLGRGAGQVALNTPHGGLLHYAGSSLAGRLLTAVERATWPLTDAYIFESAFAARAFGVQLGLPPCPAAVIHNGLAPDEFEAVPLDPDACDFLFVGEFRDLKGVDVLVDAMLGLSRPDGVPATLAMVGDGPDFSAIAARIIRAGLSDRIKLLGVQPVRAALRRGRHLIVPSRKESLPYVVLEGFAAGRAVLATHVGGVSEIFGPAASRLVAPGDAEALRAGMRQLLDDPNAAAAQAAQHRDFVRVHFTLAHMTDQIEQLYYEALRRRRA